MRTDITFRTPAGRAVDLRVHTRAGTRLSDADHRLRTACGVTSEAPFWTSDTRASPSMRFGEAGLRDGCELLIGAPAERPPPVPKALRLSVVGGADAGRTVALRPGTTRVGRAPDCDVQLSDPDVSRHHLDLTVSSAGVRARDAGSRNGTSLEGVEVTTLVPVTPGQLLRLGDSLIAVGAAHDPPALLRPADDGSVRVIPTGASAPAVPTVEIATATDETPATGQRIPWIAAAVPLLAGVLFALVTHSVQFLMFTLLAPLTIVGTALGDRLTGRRKRRRHRGEQLRRAAATSEEIVRTLTAETASRRSRDPDPAALGAIATVPTVRLWERSFATADLLRVRVGTADLPSSAAIRRGPTVASAGSLWGVPVTVDLAAGPLGIAGPQPVARALARWVIAQLVTLVPPGRVRLGVFVDEDGAEWRWMRWLPHLRAGLGVTPAARQELIKDLDRLIAEREAEHQQPRWPSVVIVVDADSDDCSALSRVLERGRAVGVSAVWVARASTGSPPGCANLVRTTGETGSRISVSATDVSGAARGGPLIAVADLVTVEWADKIARALAPLSDGDDGRHPEDAPALLRTPGMRLDGIEERWRGEDSRLRTQLGWNSSGPVWVDLVQDGPHALVAGTTGSGKSELLRTIVAGLALRRSPESVTFLLVDYKGGAAFAECARLPHVTGVVTDLDPQLTTRALRSLECEIRRRERLFAAAAADDLVAYRSQAGGEPIPRLVIVVDEFATLAAELPDFVQGLVAVAQRGRSLGVHLVLATQRPGTCVSPDIRANTALRISLRVADPAESYDLIGRADAAHIGKDSPGRAVIARGDCVEDVQVSHLGTRSRAETDDLRIELLDDWRQVAGEQDSDVDSGPTDLARIVDAVTAAADRRGAGPVRAPWLPPLADAIPLGSLPVDPLLARVTFGLADRPDRQAQRPETVDLGAGGAVLVAGGSRSGRSTALRTIAVASVRRLPPRDLHLYVIDCGGGALADLRDLPQCVTATCSAEWDVVAELVRQLELSILPRRQQVTARGNADHATGSVAAPAQLVLIDEWDEFVSASADRDLGRTADAAARVIAAAGSAATTIVISGGRTALASRVASAIPVKYLLRLADRADYGLAGLSPREVPAAMPPGRALRAPDGVEVQIGHGDEGTPVAGPPRRPGDGISLRPLPAAVRVADLPASPRLLRLGVTTAADTVAGLPADTPGGLLVAGPSGSGRSTALGLLLSEAVRTGLATVVAATPGSSLHRAAEACGVPVLDPTAPRGEHIATSRLVLVDDAELFVDTPIDEDACAVLTAGTGAQLVVAAIDARSLSRMYRGLVPALIRNGRALLLAPAPADAELFGARLPPGPPPPRIPGRGVLIGSFPASAGHRPGAPTSWVQIAHPEETGVPGVEAQPMWGYR